VQKLQTRSSQDLRSFAGSEYHIISWAATLCHTMSSKTALGVFEILWLSFVGLSSVFSMLTLLPWSGFILNMPSFTLLLCQPLA
jgi:hypothetical protein